MRVTDLAAIASDLILFGHGIYRHADDNSVFYHFDNLAHI